VVVDQRSLGRSSRGNAGTYLGIFDEIRRVFARATGRPASLFSFNSTGACPACKGQGSIAVEMNFLDDVRVECATCGGRRYTDEVLALRWDGRSIHDVLSLTAGEAAKVFTQKRVQAPLGLLCEVGLDYVTLGQPLSTLSGGECQRLKLATELGKTGNLYVLDEPTTGLHMADISRLMAILERLVDDGNSVVVIEHNLDVISRADWVIDLGPDGGSRGGEILAQGTPEQVAQAENSQTGRYLRAILDGERAAT
jgi:excinuclease ABC A subunit